MIQKENSTTYAEDAEETLVIYIPRFTKKVLKKKKKYNHRHLKKIKNRLNLLP